MSWTGCYMNHNWYVQILQSYATLQLLFKFIRNLKRKCDSPSQKTFSVKGVCNTTVFVILLHFYHSNLHLRCIEKAVADLSLEVWTTFSFFGDKEMKNIANFVA